MTTQKELPNDKETTHMQLMKNLEMTKQLNNDCMKD
jgi:hypothetical protein